MMKTLMIVTTFGLAAALVGGCDDDNSSKDMAGMDMSASEGGSGFPAAPTLGATQIDRMGRAGVNTALTAPFFDPAVPAQKTDHEMKQDAYNKAAQSSWPSFVPEIAANLAVLDGLDGICDNQPKANVGAGDGGASVGEYGTLASILANDELLLYAPAASCVGAGGASNYLAVEVSVIGGTPAPASCGGRTPLDNTIDVTYAVVSGGIVSGVAVVNGPTADADPNVANLATFPFLGAPNP